MEIYVWIFKLTWIWSWCNSAERAVGQDIDKLVMSFGQELPSFPFIMETVEMGVRMLKNVYIMYVYVCCGFNVMFHSNACIQVSEDYVF